MTTTTTTLAERTKTYNDYNIPFGMDISVLKFVSNNTGSVGSLFPANGVMAMIFGALLFLLVLV